MLAGEVQPVVNLVRHNNAVGIATCNGQQGIDVIGTAHRAARIVGVDEHEKTNIVVHFLGDVAEIRFPPVVAVELIFHGLCTVHLRIGHVRWVVRSRCEDFGAFLKDGGKQ